MTPNRVYDDFQEFLRKGVSNSDQAATMAQGLAIERGLTRIADAILSKGNDPPLPGTAIGEIVEALRMIGRKSPPNVKIR